MGDGSQLQQAESAEKGEEPIDRRQVEEKRSMYEARARGYSLGANLLHSSRNNAHREAIMVLETAARLNQEFAASLAVLLGEIPF